MKLPTGTRVGEFEVKQDLGIGGFGITYKAWDHDLERFVVVKENLPTIFACRDRDGISVVPLRREDKAGFNWSVRNFQRESRLLAAFEHPNIVKVTGRFQKNGTAYYVMPFIEGRSLEDEIAIRKEKGQSFSKDELDAIVNPLLDALETLHSGRTTATDLPDERLPVYHRDVKPGNILITNDDSEEKKIIPILIDFGSAREYADSKSVTLLETAGFSPFELIQSNGQVGPWSDLYGLAACIYQAITFTVPPRAANRVTTDDEIRKLSSEPKLVALYGRAFLTVVDKALEREISDRPQSAEEWRRLRDEFESRQVPRRKLLKIALVSLAIAIFSLVAWTNGRDWIAKKPEPIEREPIERDQTGPVTSGTPFEKADRNPSNIKAIEDAFHYAVSQKDTENEEKYLNAWLRLPHSPFDAEKARRLVKETHLSNKKKGGLFNEVFRVSKNTDQKALDEGIAIGSTACLHSRARAFEFSPPTDSSKMIVLAKSFRNWQGDAKVDATLNRKVQRLVALEGDREAMQWMVKNGTEDEKRQAAWAYYKKGNPDPGSPDLDDDFFKIAVKLKHPDALRIAADAKSKEKTDAIEDRINLALGEEDFENRVEMLKKIESDLQKLDQASPKVRELLGRVNYKIYQVYWASVEGGATQGSFSQNPYEKLGKKNAEDAFESLEKAAEDYKNRDASAKLAWVCFTGGELGEGSSADFERDWERSMSLVWKSRPQNGEENKPGHKWWAQWRATLKNLLNGGERKEDETEHRKAIAVLKENGADLDELLRVAKMKEKYPKIKKEISKD